jgi:hypothetical protein
LEGEDEMAETQATTGSKAAKPAAGKPATEPKVTTIVVKFPVSADAERAFRALNKTLRDEDKAIYQGAVVSRREDGELRIKDMRDLGLTNIIVDAADATMSIGLGSLGLLLGIAGAGLNVLVSTVRLAKNSAGQVVGLASETLAYPRRKMLCAYEAGPEVVKASKGLAPGETAIVVTADEKTALDLAADLKNSGGEVV